jgi:hypothetical protein
MPSVYLWAAAPALCGWSAGVWAGTLSQALFAPPVLLPAVWIGVGPAWWWADVAAHWGLRGC